MMGWRTITFNGVVALAGVVATTVSFLSTFDWATVVPPRYVGPIVLVLGVANIWLRFITTTPIFTAPPERDPYDPEVSGL